MAHRYGIPRARDSAGLVWDREAIELVPRPFTEPLTCAGCSATVHPVRGSSRTTQRATAAVKAHYRLNPKGTHGEGCPYDFERRAHELVRDSHGSLVRTREQWRLLLPSRSEIRAMDSATARAKASQPRGNLRVTRTRARLDAALNSAAKIARLLAKFDDDPELANQFRAAHGQQVVTWNDFHFGPGDYDRLRHRLETDPPEHPLAVSGSTYSLTTGTTGTSYVLRAYGRARSPHRWIPIVLRASDRSLLPSDENAHWIAFGHWESWSTAAGYRELRTWINAPWQITSWFP